MEMLRQHGLSDVEMDAEGNVMGVRRGTRAAGGPRAGRERAPRHRVPRGHRREGEAAGHAAVGARASATTRAGSRCSSSLVRALDAAKFTTPGDILFVGNVGEEGEGDLRGVEVPAAEGQVQGPHQADAGHRRRRYGERHARRRRQHALPRHVQGARRPQLRRVRPGESGLRDGRGDREVRAPRGALVAEDHLRRRRRPRRHVGELDSRRGQHGHRPAIRIVRRAEEGQRRVPGRSCREAVDEENKTRSTREGRIEADPKVIGDRPCGATPADVADRPGDRRRDPRLRR